MYSRIHLRPSDPGATGAVRAASLRAGTPRTRREALAASACCLAAAVVVSTAPFAGALAMEPLREPTGRVILTVTGNIEAANADGQAQFDRDMLREIGVTRMTTSTVWTDGTPEFEGVLARDVLRAVGASGTTVQAVALNDYAIEIPISDFEIYPVMFAFRMNGVDLTARDKGPLWIVYPRDDYEEIQNQKADAKWVWQLARIVVQ